MREQLLVDRLRPIEKAIEDTRDAIAFSVDGDQLGDLLCEAVQLQTRLNALVGEIADNAYGAGVTAGTGQRSIAQYVASRTNTDPAPVRATTKLVEWLRDFPTLAEAYSTGELTESHLKLLRTKIDNPRTHRYLIGDQQLFVDAGRDCSYRDFCKVAEYWLIRVDVDGEEPKDQEQNTSLQFSRGSGGRLVVRAELDALSGQAIETAIETEARKVRDDDIAQGTERTIAQRRAQALLNLVTRGASRSGGSVPSALINIVMSQAVAEWLLANDGADEHVPVHWNDTDGRCELIDGTPVHPAHALKIFGTATLRRHILDANSRILDTSYNARTFPEWVKNAVRVQSRGQCETHGCDASYHWLQTDHIEPHSRGGPTRFDNAQTQCSSDNQAKTNATGHTPWHNKPPPPKHQPRQHE